MKKVFIVLLIMTGVIIIGQQFVIQKNVSVFDKSIKPKDLLSDLIDLEKRVPQLLHAMAKLLDALHTHIEACVDGDKQACTKKKDSKSKSLYKEHIAMVNNAMTNLERYIAELVTILKINNGSTQAKGC
ncbi:hypothetical protein EKK58_02765 [Candidatus Dependentiae bacterium]|nr:MAG: hypothetical protein EKK58_02765 [Candidatus Dependentiae bacterium]